MANKTCGHLGKCGCESYLTTPPPCPTPEGCPDPQPCSEVFPAECIIYTGDDILCDETTVVAQGMTAAEAMEAIVDYFCNSTGSISQNITCGEDIVVLAGSTFADAFESVVNYFCLNSGLTIVEGDNETINVTLVGDTYTVSQLDTGWVNLNGFDYYQGLMASQKPQVRRIGKQIHFRGNLYIPLGNGIITPLVDPDTYRTTLSQTPYVGAGGVIYDADDRLYFNSDGSVAQSVIPTSVLPVGTVLDGEYKLAREIASRQIRVFDVLQPPNLEGTALLHAPIELAILPNKQMRITALQTLEQNAADQTPFIGASSLRNITSSFRYRSFMLDFRSFQFIQDGLNSSLNPPQIGGVFTIGEMYYIQEYMPGDDFTNVGAAVNASQQVFIATGITPTDWTNGSRIINIPQSIQSYDYFYPNFSLGGASQWPLLDGPTALDAANPYDIGGFVISLDGLVAFLQ
jgi:hypothetical protein